MRARLRALWSALLRLGFRLLYEEMAWTYDTVSWLVSFGAWRAWQRAALPFLQGPSVLEIAHGPGHMLLALHEAGYEVTGLDRSRQMGALSQRRLRRAGARILLVRGAAQQLPFPAGRFDSVLATFPTDFVIAVETLQGVRRVLKQDGRFVIVPEASFTGSSTAERFVDWLYAITGQRAGRGPRKEAETQEAMWQQIQARFTQAGFQLQVETVSLPSSEVTVIVARKGE